MSIESATLDVRQHAARAVVISVALISRLIPRTPADYVYTCVTSARMYAVVVSEVITHSLEIKSMISCVGGFLHIKYSYITRRVPTKSLSHGHLRLGRTSCLTHVHVHVCWSDTHWNLVFVNSVQAWSGGRVRPFSSGQFKDGKIQGSAKNGQFKDNWSEG